HVRCCHRAQRITREHSNSGCTSLLPQLQRVAHIGGGEEIDALAPFDALPHQPRRSELGTHCATMLGLIISSDLGHDFAQTPSTVQYQFLAASSTAQDPAQQERGKTPVDHTPDHSSGYHNTCLLCCKMASHTFLCASCTIGSIVGTVSGVN